MRIAPETMMLCAPLSGLNWLCRYRIGSAVAACHQATALVFPVHHPRVGLGCLGADGFDRCGQFDPAAEWLRRLAIGGYASRPAKACRAAIASHRPTGGKRSTWASTSVAAPKISSGTTKSQQCSMAIGACSLGQPKQRPTSRPRTSALRRRMPSRSRSSWRRRGRPNTRGRGRPLFGRFRRRVGSQRRLRPTRRQGAEAHTCSVLEARTRVPRRCRGPRPAGGYRVASQRLWWPQWVLALTRVPGSSSGGRPLELPAL